MSKADVQADAHVKADARKKFEILLDQHHDWPADYTFKFIVPHDQENHLLALLDGLNTSVRGSSGGKYSAVTVVGHFSGAEEVMEIYDRVQDIKGLMSL